MIKHLFYREIDTNLSGVRHTLLLIAAERITGFPEPDIENNNSISLSAIEGITEDEWIRIDVRDNDGILTWLTKETDEGKLYNYKIEATVALTDAERDVFLSTLSRKEWVVAAEDNNGKLRVVGWAEGNECQGMTLEIESTTGKKTELNGYKLRFTMESCRVAYAGIMDIDIPSES